MKLPIKNEFFIRSFLTVYLSVVYKMILVEAQQYAGVLFLQGAIVPKRVHVGKCSHRDCYAWLHTLDPP